MSAGKDDFWLVHPMPWDARLKRRKVAIMRQHPGVYPVTTVTAA